MIGTIARTAARLALAASLSLPAHAGVIVYDFTGIVTSIVAIGPTDNLPTVAVGDTITGTYSFNLSNGNPSQGAGVVGSASLWQVVASGGTGNGTVVPTGLVFWSQAQDAGSVVYATRPLSSFDTLSTITADDPNNYSGGEAIGTRMPPGILETGSGFQVDTNGPAYSSDGSPELNPPFTGSGYFFADYSTSNSVDQSQVNYAITSLTPVAPVPLPATAWLMLSGIGGLAVMAQRRRIASYLTRCRMI